MLFRSTDVSGLSSNLLGEERNGSLGEQFLHLLQMHRIVEQGFEPRHQDVHELLGRIRGEMHSSHASDSLDVDLRRGGCKGMGVRDGNDTKTGGMGLGNGEDRSNRLWGGSNMIKFIQHEEATIVSRSSSTV